ncbi:MAG TPA: tRNA (cytidine(34)-2'-O)-methyltransferase [Burkholderiales bacterium]|nr:tRNA (cytidine(34)-2'-O)-methyltransferase [Burkholderiales bacterium]
MFHVVLYQPEIPPNTGNVIRLCANSGATLHLVKPLGFSLEDKQLRRAGLDYREMAGVHLHETWEACAHLLQNARIFAVGTKAQVPHHEPVYAPGDAFLFGPETRGLPPELYRFAPPERRIRIPMRPGNRSLNLSNAVAVVVYEAWRQLGFAGASG